LPPPFNILTIERYPFDSGWVILRGALAAILGLAFISVALFEAAGPFQPDVCEGGGFSGVWYSMSGPPDEWSMEQFMQAEPEDESKFWIVDCSGSQKETSLEVPPLGWVRLLLAPAADGELSLHIQYPTGTVERELLGSVTAGSQYLIWHQAEAVGDYELWYSVEGGDSSPVDLVVQELEISATPYASVGSSSGSGGGSLGRGVAIPAAAPAMSLAMSSAAESIGFSVGGAKDIGNFRENIEEGYLPLQRTSPTRAYSTITTSTLEALDDAISFSARPTLPPYQATPSLGSLAITSRSASTPASLTSLERSSTSSSCSTTPARWKAPSIGTTTISSGTSWIWARISIAEARWRSQTGRS